MPSPPFPVDIWGRPWSPCAGCPHPTPGACCARRHPRYCELVQADPERWGPVVASEPSETREATPVAFEASAPRPVPNSEPHLPSFSRMAGQIFGAGVAVAAHVVKTGRFKAAKDEQDRRWAICKACDHFRATDKRCGKADGCGCYLEKKIPLEAARCPIGKWDAGRLDPPEGSPREQTDPPAGPTKPFRDFAR